MSAAALQLAEAAGLPVFPCRAREETIDGKLYSAKSPYPTHGFLDASRSTEQITAWWNEHTDALVGVPTGAASKLLVVDVDPDGAEWYREHADELAPGRVHRTRRGHHLLYRYPAGAEIRNSAGKLAPGVDVRGEGGYIIWWPAHGCETTGDLEDLAEPPEWLLTRLTAAPNGHDHHDDRGADDGDHVREGGRSDYLSREAYRLRKQGTSVEQILIVLRALNQARCMPPLEEAELEMIAGGKRRVLPDVKASEGTAPESLSLDDMLVRFVQVARGPIIVDVSNTYRRLRPGEFSAAYAHLKIVIDRKAVPMTALWAQSERRMAVDCLAFHPGEAQFYIERGLRHLNIWAPPSWPSGDAAAATPFLEHLAYLIPDERQREDLFDWLAHAAQRPEIRPHFHFLLVAAQEGTGRSWLVEVLRRLWGERHAGETDLHRLLDDSFNSVLSGKIVVAVHEVKAPADERYSHRDRLKSLLTDSTITINEKHEPRWTERFCARFLMFTNRDDALPLSETDRRVYAIRCADEPKDAAYYTKLYALIEDQNFLAAVWQVLRARDITGFNPGKRAPLTEMKEQMIAAGRTEEQQTAVEFVHACPYEVVGAADLMRMLVPHRDGEKDGERRGRISAVVAGLREIGCQTHAKKVRIAEDVMRVWVLKNPAKWTRATTALLSEQATGIRKEFVNASWNPETMIEMWRA